MQSGYKVIWTERAANDLKGIFAYLEKEWREKEIKNFALELNQSIIIISQNPNIFPHTKQSKNLRKCTLTKHNNIYYKIKNDTVAILTILDTR